MTGATALDVARRLVDAWNARNLDDFIGLLARDVEWYDPAMPEPPARGRAAVRAFAEGVLRAFPDFAYEVQHPICSSSDGTRCALAWRISATHLHSLEPLGYAPTGRRADIEGVDVLDIRDGQVVRILTAFDVLSAAEQLLGMKLRPAPGTWRGRFAVAIQRALALVRRKRNEGMPSESARSSRPPRLQEKVVEASLVHAAGGIRMYEPINIERCFEMFADTFSPKIIAELNGQLVMLVRCEGDKVPWHMHAEEDELFFVLEGELEVQERNRKTTLRAGEMYVIKRGTEHRVVPIGHVKLMLFEPAGIEHTGKVESEITKKRFDRLER